MIESRCEALSKSNPSARYRAGGFLNFYKLPMSKCIQNLYYVRIFRWDRCIKIVEYEMKNELKTYEVPATSMARLSLESAFLAASQPVQEIGKEDVTVKVEEYDTFENQVTFD